MSKTPRASARSAQLSISAELNSESPKTNTTTISSATATILNPKKPADGSTPAKYFTPDQRLAIQSALFTWHATFGRAHLPWRGRHNPYYVVVSEFMLQQTQVDRVVPLFRAFIEQFPNFATLAAGSRAEIIRLWKGLGYNSRAVRLHELARQVVMNHDGALPRDADALRALPGVGPYTLAAISAFAFNAPVIAFDTNLRRILHRVYWGVEHPYQAPLAEIEAGGRDLLAEDAGREWNAAMMDLGSSLCTARAPKCLLCPLQKWCAAAPIDPALLALRARTIVKKSGPQGKLKFEDTIRFARGRIIDRLRTLPEHARISLLDLHADLQDQLAGRDAAAVEQIVGDLVRDGLVDRSESGVCLHA